MAGLIMKYFVLKPKGTDIYAQASREALRAYARTINNANPHMADDLHNWTVREAEAAREREKVNR